MTNAIERAFIAIGKGIAYAWHELLRNECRKDRKTYSTRLMFILPADHPNVTGRVVISATDSEGNPVDIDDERVTIETNSTNPELVEMVFDNDEDPATFELHIGRPSESDVDIASVEAVVTVDGVPVQVAGAQFMITTGALDPSSVRANIQFDGITESPSEPTE